ncbi:SSI family serine proteinase inhibitor [Nocardiopsis potens]|uniref:SSI family serine proteinase inhibitor n=1 Tax=Nocardiopsis potens TaxID=1246458 RepID=UPI00034C3509|nr:SSI family serine proteinase inhibitor [Nocardiopsis potens]
MLKRLAPAVAAALVAAGAAGLAGAAPAQADGAPQAGSRLVLSWSEGEGGTSRSATLTCRPAGGSHPSAAEACAALESAGGDFSSLPSSGGACTMEHRPVRLSARGHWGAEPVDYAETFGNPCTARNGTAGVFAF